MSGTQGDRRSVTVRFAVSEKTRANPNTRGKYLESLDLDDGETLGGLFAWMDDEEQRDRLRQALSFDMFAVYENFLSYRSEDLESAYLHQGSMVTGKRWWMPRPPLVEILDDWEQFLQGGEPFDKVYSWEKPTRAADSPDNVTTSGTRTSSVTVHFGVDDRNKRPRASTDNVDSRGADRLAGIFSGLPCSYEQVVSLLEQRETLSMWSVSSLIRCTSSEVRVWKNEESDPDDFAVLSRSQFEAMMRDWVAFRDQPTPMTKTYTDS